MSVPSLLRQCAARTTGTVRLLSRSAGSNKRCFLHTSTPAVQKKENVLDVFDRKAKTLHRERAAAMEDPTSFDYIKEEIGYRVADRVMDVSRPLEVCVDVGCGRGYVTRHLSGPGQGRSIKKVYALEMSKSMLDQMEYPPEEEGIEVEIILMDEDSARLPFDDESVDLVTSSLSAHWVNDLPGLFKEVRRILKKDGVFIGSLFGGDTLFELRCSLQMAEVEREGGFASHVSPFVQVQDLGNLLNRTGFTMLTIDSDEMIVGFPTVFQLMRDLKGMAENNASWNRKSHLHRDTIVATDAIYRELYPHEQGGIQATFQVQYWIGWKPDPSQPKPLKPNQSADISLKDIYKLDEVVSQKMGEKGFILPDGSTDQPPPSILDSKKKKK